MVQADNRSPHPPLEASLPSLQACSSLAWASLLMDCKSPLPSSHSKKKVLADPVEPKQIRAVLDNAHVAPRNPRRPAQRPAREAERRSQHRIPIPPPVRPPSPTTTSFSSYPCLCLTSPIPIPLPPSFPNTLPATISAWEHTKTLPLDAFGPDPLLKTTGIGITLGGILEQSSDLAAAYDVYEDVFWALRTAHLRPSAGTGTGSGDGNGDGNGNGNAQGEGEQGLPPPSTRDTRPPLGVETLQGLSSADKMRAVALAYKLGELAHALGRPRAEEERWLVWSVEAILRTVLDTPPVGAVEVVRTVGTGAEGGVGGAEARPNLKVLVEQLGLPLWAMRHDLAAPFEALGTFYAEEGNVP